MAVDYTKVFTAIGSHVDKIIDYYAYIATYTADQLAIESMLSSQSLVRMEGDLVDLYDSMKSDISSNIGELVARVTDIITDDTLIGQNFSFGQLPTLEVVWPALIEDMLDNAKHIKANVATVGSATYDTFNGNVGFLLTGQTLDAITPPITGAPVIRNYYGLTTQLTPTSETLQLTCISDSLPNNTPGSEVFTITGTGAGSSGYDPEGENSGSLGSIVALDSQTSSYITNASFDNWTAGVLDSWTDEEGAVDTEYEDIATTMQGTGFSIKTIQSGNAWRIAQSIPTNRFELGKSYFMGIWSAKNTDVAGDQTIDVSFVTSAGASTVSVAPTSTAWGFTYRQVLVPIDEISANLEIQIASSGTLGVGNDAVLLDQIIFAPCEYFNGIAIGVTTGPQRFVTNDTIRFTISNSDAGKFQTFFRKAYGVQLPTNATPSISDSLVA